MGIIVVRHTISCALFIFYITLTESLPIEINFDRLVDFDNCDINVFPSTSFSGARTVLDCSRQCNGMCYMFSYDKDTRTCSLYDLPVTGVINTVSQNIGRIYYRNKDKECAAGNYYDGNSCIPCTPGSYQDVSGMTSCSLCAPGSYQNGHGKTSCTPCSPGSYQNVQGMTSCTPCSPGSYQNVQGMTSCSLCAPGSYQSNHGKTSCTPCSPGSYQNAQGMTNCTQCAPGSYQNDVGKTACLSCPTDHYQDDPGQSGCKECLDTPDSRHEVSNGGTQCKRCYIFFTSYCYGDMSNVIKTVTGVSSGGGFQKCMDECDTYTNCIRITFNNYYDRCNLHSTTSYSYGYDPDDRYYKRYC